MGRSTPMWRAYFLNVSTRMACLSRFISQTIRLRHPRRKMPTNRRKGSPSLRLHERDNECLRERKQSYTRSSAARHPAPPPDYLALSAGSAPETAFPFSLLSRGDLLL